MNPNTELTHFLETTATPNIWQKWKSVREKYTKDQNLGLDYFLCLLSNDYITNLWPEFPSEDKESFKSFCRDKKTEKSKLNDFYEYIRNPENPWFALKASPDIVSFLREVLNVSETNAEFLKRSSGTLFLWMVGGIKYYTAPSRTSRESIQLLSEEKLTQELFIGIILDNYDYYKERSIQKKNFELKYLIREFGLNKALDQGIKNQCYNEGSSAFIFSSDEIECEEKLRYLIDPNYLESLFPEVPFRDLNEFKTFFRTTATKEFSQKFVSVITSNAKYWLVKKAQQPIRTFLEKLLIQKDTFEVTSRNSHLHTLCTLMGLKAYTPCHTNTEIELKVQAPNLDYKDRVSLFSEIFLLNRSFFRNFEDSKIQSELNFLINTLGLSGMISLQKIKRFEDLLFAGEQNTCRETFKAIFEDNYLEKLYPNVPFESLDEFKKFSQTTATRSQLTQLLSEDLPESKLWKKIKASREIQEFILQNEVRASECDFSIPVGNCLIVFISGIKFYAPSFLSQETLALLENGKSSNNLLLNVFREGFDYFEEKFKKKKFSEIDWLISAFNIEREYDKNDPDGFKKLYNSLLAETQNSTNEEPSIGDLVQISYIWNKDIFVVEVDKSGIANISLGKVNMMQMSPEPVFSEISSKNFTFEVENIAKKDPLKDGFLFFDRVHQITLTPDHEESVTKDYFFNILGLGGESSRINVKVSYQPIFFEIIEKTIFLPMIHFQSELNSTLDITIPFKAQNISDWKEILAGIEVLVPYKEKIDQIKITSSSLNSFKVQIKCDESLFRLQFRKNRKLYGGQISESLVSMDTPVEQIHEMPYRVNTNLGDVGGLLALRIEPERITVLKKNAGFYSLISNTKQKVENLTYTYKGKTVRIGGFIGTMDLRLDKAFNADLSIQSNTITIYEEKNIFNDDLDQKDRKHVGIFSSILVNYFRFLHFSFWFLTYFLFTYVQRRFSSNSVFYHYYIWIVVLECMVLFLEFEYLRQLAYLPEMLYTKLAYNRLSFLSDHLITSRKKARNDFALLSGVLLLHLFLSLFFYPYSRLLTIFRVPYADINVISKADGAFPYTWYNPSATVYNRKLYTGDLGDIVVEFLLFVGVVLILYNLLIYCKKRFLKALDYS